MQKRKKSRRVLTAREVRVLRKALEEQSRVVHQHEQELKYRDARRRRKTWIG